MPTQVYGRDSLRLLCLYSLLGEFSFEDCGSDQKICLLYRDPEPLDSGAFFDSTAFQPVVERLLEEALFSS